jgi:hypothetical protein
MKFLLPKFSNNKVVKTHIIIETLFAVNAGAPREAKNTVVQINSNNLPSLLNFSILNKAKIII